MKKLCIAIVFLAFSAAFMGCGSNEEIIPVNVEANNTVLSCSKLWVVTEKGELAVLQLNQEQIAHGQTEQKVKAVGGVTGIMAISKQSDFSDLIYVIKNDGTVWQVIELAGTDHRSISHGEGA